MQDSQELFYDRINYRKGNLLSVQEGIIVHGCNLQGIMGAGVAKAIKEKYPACYREYRLDYSYKNLYLGSVSWWEGEEVADDFYIANAITQKEFGTHKRQVNYAAIVKCFEKVFSKAQIYGLAVHFPKIGAGLGGGDWNIIEQLILDCDPDNQVLKVCWEL